MSDGLTNSSQEHQPIAVICLTGDPSVMGNAESDSRDVLRAAQRAAKAIAAVVREGFQAIVIPPGGAAIERELLRNEESATKVAPSTMSEAAAAAQGSAGMRLENALRNTLKQEGLALEVATLVTPFLVSAEDPAFSAPKRPVGPLMTAWRAKEVSRQRNLQVVEEAGKGWRRVVATPVPVECLGLSAIEGLLAANQIVLTAAGGGVPVVIDSRGNLSETEALHDEVEVATLLANEIAAQLVIFMHSTEHLVTDAGQVSQSRVERVTRHQLRSLLESGAFEDVSAARKVTSALDFLDAGGEDVLITSAQKLTAALAGRAGTRITREVLSEDTQQISLFAAQSDGEPSQSE